MNKLRRGGSAMKGGKAKKQKRAPKAAKGAMKGSKSYK